MARKLALMILLNLACIGAAYAQNFTLTSNGDTVAANPTTSPLDSTGQVTLRSAIMAATQWSAGGAHVITIPASITTINLTLGQMTVGSAANNSITINGPGKAVLTINQTTAARIFSTTTAVFTFAVNDLTFNQSFVGATTISGGGGAIVSGGPTGTSTTYTNVAFTNFTIQIGNGGAISDSFNTAPANHTLTVTNCDFTGNKAGGGGGAISYNGPGTATITGSRFTNNSTGPLGSNTGGSGGAISTTGAGNGGTYSITKNTFTGNQTLANTLGIGGGAIANVFGIATINFNRFINNTAANASSGNTIYETGGGTAGFQNINADNNWWGTSTGPAASDTSTVNGVPAGVITLNNWLQLKTTASPSSTVFGQTSALTASFLSNSAGGAVSAANLSQLIGLPVAWSASGGGLSGQQTTVQAAGTATATYLGTSVGSGSATAVVDNGPPSGSTNTATITTGQAATTVGLTSNHNPAYFKQAITFTATINVTAPGGGSPGGTVNFLINGVASINNCSARPVVAGQAQCVSGTTMLDHLGPGSLTISAVYSGDGSFSTSTGNLTGNPQIVLTATAANVTVSGRVMTFEGRGIRNAIVTLTDQRGASRNVMVDPLGNFRFDEVESGQTYVISVTSRRFAFAARAISIVDDLTDVDFTPSQ